MPTVDKWAQFSWSWATKEQTEWFKQMHRPFHEATLSATVERFWRTLRVQWFLGWPIIPELIAEGLLPPEASRKGYEASEEEWDLVEARKAKRFEQVKMALSWYRRVRWQQENRACLLDGPRPPVDWAANPDGL